ncbi:AAA family ATPase [Paenibacillus sp. CMAA1364]
MKPITLKLSGLQSYREMQQIDFDDLTQMGLFGIFGPTGSGKSTLLDAITLSLYGKVERAVNGTQGIMNHSEDALFVSFTFELMSSEGAQQYRVERRFKRVNELSISNTISRFIEVTPEGDVVMADKLAEVTRCVEEKIGLKMDDFTRAVVLPQGKFAEFLALKGTERRQMLQRLFHLEQYGDQLGQKLSRRVKENEAMLRNIEAEQQGLGNASKDALEQTQNRRAEAVVHAETSRLRLQEMSMQAERLMKVWEWQMERDLRHEQLLQLASFENEVKVLEDRLSKASVAQQLLPILTQMKENKEAYLSRESSAIRLRTKQQEAEQVSLCAIEVDDAAKLKGSIEEPKLLTRQDQLEQAVKLQQERDTLRNECHNLDVMRTNASRSRSDLQEQLLKEKELLSKGQKKQAELQLSLKSLETRSQDRALIHQAIQRKHVIQSSEEQHQMISKEYEIQVHTLAEMSSKLRKSEQDVLKNKHQHTHLMDQITSHIDMLHEQYKWINQEISRLCSDEREVTTQIVELETHELSVRLVTQLHDGHPCPVCGSEQHPHPVVMMNDGEELVRLKEQKVVLQQIDTKLQDDRLEIRQLLLETRTMMEQVGAPLPDEYDLLTMEVPELSKSSNQEITVFSEQLWGDKVRQLKETLQECKRKTTTLKQDIILMKENDIKRQQQHMKYMADIDALKNIHAETTKKLERISEDLSKLLADWQEQYPDLPMLELEKRFEWMQKKDAEVETIKERIEISIPFIDQKGEMVRSIEQQISELDKSYIQWNTQWEGKHEQLMQQEERLFTLVGKNSAEGLLEECVQQLAVLRQASEQSSQARRNAEEKKHEAIKDAVIAQQALDSAVEHYKAALTRWEQMLAQSILSSAEEVMGCCIHPEEEKKYTEKITAHRDQEREVKLQLAHVVDRLSGQSLSLEDWEICKTSLEESRQADEAALQLKARAERDLEDVITRHSRWMELEKERTEGQMNGDQLSKLQSCLRGNAFVEYIAEEQLMQVSQAASQRLLFLTRQRYALEVDSAGGFVIRDDANGGIRRPVSTLSGGETFLTSLSLALALSAQIQLRGQYPLQFFFLDEGFGTLDPELLEMVITSLERLHNDHLSVGIISHVPELRARLPRKLVVLPAENAGAGSRLVVENM